MSVWSDPDYPYAVVTVLKAPGRRVRWTSEDKRLAFVAHERWGAGPKERALYQLVKKCLPPAYTAWLTRWESEPLA